MEDKTHRNNETSATCSPLSEENIEFDVPSSEMMQAIVKTWRKEKIYKTKGVAATVEKILSQECVCVVGVPGAGKSTAIHHAALSLENDGFVIYCIDEPKELLEYFDEDKQQVFILNNILGIYSLKQDKVDLWEVHNAKIKNVLGTNTKLLVSIRTQLYNQAVKDNDFVFLSKSTCIDFSDETYRLDTADMLGMLTHYLTVKGVDKVDDLIRQIFYPEWWTEKELHDITEEKRQAIMSGNAAKLDKFSQCFPLLCKVFCSEESVRHHPLEFFTNPFQALTQIFQKIKSDDKVQFCGLVLCTVFDGKLTEGMFDINCELDDESVTLRKVVLTCFDLEEQKYLSQIESALNSLDGVYITLVENTYQMTHRVFHDVVTYLFNDTQPLFVIKYGTSEFIYDRIRLSKTHPLDDPYMIIINDAKNIQRLADRLFKDLMSDTWKGSVFISRNPNIGDERLLSCLFSKLSDRGQTYKTQINELFIQCMRTVHYNKDTNTHGDVTQYKLIEFCIQTGVDCNMFVVGVGYPLHISVRTGSLRLTQLLLHNGADKRRVDWRCYSVLHLVCRKTKYNRLKLIKLLIEHGGDQSVVEFVISDRYRIPYGLEDFIDRHRILQQLHRDNIQLEVVLPDNSVKVLTTDKHEMKHYIEHCTGKLQLVRREHDNILTYVDLWGRNILHYTHDYVVAEYLLGYECLQLDINRRDKKARTPYWYVLNDKKPVMFDTEDVVVEDKEDMINLYKKYGAVLYGSEDNSDENRDDNSDENRDDNSDENSDDNSDENSDDNSDENSDDNSDENRDDNSDENSDDNSDENSDDNSDENRDDNSDENRDDNSDENSDDNSDENRDDNSDENRNDNSDEKNDKSDDNDDESGDDAIDGKDNSY